MRRTWLWINLAMVLLIVAGGYYIARQWNPARPYIGEPTAQHFAAFARNFNNASFDEGKGYTSYAADLKRTDSLSNPLVGEFVAMIDGHRIIHRFAWQGRWVSLDGGESVKLRADRSQ